MRPEYDPSDVAEALRKASGLKSVAARILGCSRTTIYRHIAEYPEVAEAARDARAETLDRAESQLLAIVLDRDHKDHFSAVRFLLRTVGRARGYGDRMEVSGPEGGPVQITGTLGDAIAGAMRQAGLPMDDDGDE